MGIGVALALWAAVLLACGQARLPVRQQPPGPDFLIIGHQGAPHQACENTLESFETALQLGANALELDVSMTSDQHVVLWHDWMPSIKSALRPTGMCSLRHPLLPQPLHEVPLHELLRDYGYEHAGQRIPLLTFTEFVQRLGQDDRARSFFSISKFLRIAPTLCPRSSGTPCRPCSTIVRWTKPCSSHRMRRSFTSYVTKRSAGTKPRIHA
jgi:glycerophosphoryl diester phosphodiesterase